MEWGGVVLTLKGRVNVNIKHREIEVQVRRVSRGLIWNAEVDFRRRLISILNASIARSSRRQKKTVRKPKSVLQCTKQSPPGIDI